MAALALLKENHSAALSKVKQEKQALQERCTKHYKENQNYKRKMLQAGNWMKKALRALDVDPPAKAVAVIMQKKEAKAAPRPHLPSAEEQDQTPLAQLAEVEAAEEQEAAEDSEDEGGDPTRRT